MTDAAIDVTPTDAGGLWRTEVALRVRDVRHRLATAVAGGVPADATTHIAATEQALADADAAIRERQSWHQQVARWWSGATITAAWESVHRAEAELVTIGSDKDALAAIPRLRTWMRQVLTDADELADFEQFFRDASEQHPPDRTKLRQIYQETIAANSEWHSGLRHFRNLLFVVAGGLALVLLVLAVWHAIDPSVVSLCHGQTCFGSGSRPVSRAIFEVALVGAVGGLLSSAFLIGNLDHAPSRYNLLAPQIVLKAVAGSVTALFGVLLVQSHLIVAPVGDDETAVLIAYAALFGFSQQLLTQFADKKANDLLGPQKDSSAAKKG